MNDRNNQPSQEGSSHPYLTSRSRTHDTEDSSISRRGFLGFAAASIFLAHVDQQVQRSESRNGIPYRTLGRSGERVSLIGLGGYHLGNQADPQESIRIIRTGLDEGIDFLDNCWDYNGGESEIRMGNALRDGYRQKAFLMSKIDGRAKAAATAQINEREDSLHRPQEPGHSSENAGHRVQARLRVRCRSDTSQRYGCALQQFRKTGFARVAQERHRCAGYEADGRPHDSREQNAPPVECLHYAMNLPTSVVITCCDSLPILEQALQAARSFQPMISSQVAALLARTAKAAEAGPFELYKTTHRFEGTVANPQWLG